MYLASAELSAVCAILGRLPTPEEYQKHAAELGKDSASTYKYLNFDKVESYVEAASEVTIDAATKDAAKKAMA